MKPFLAILFSAASLAAQLTGGNATITGLVMDPSGARVPNATVVATNAESRAITAWKFWSPVSPFITPTT
jgi:hypothetical protein